MSETKSIIYSHGVEYFKQSFKNPRKATLTLDSKTMQKLRNQPTGSTLLFHTGRTLSAGKPKRKYKVLRRDWKRCRVHMIETE